MSSSGQSVRRIAWNGGSGRNAGHQRHESSEDRDGLSVTAQDAQSIPVDEEPVVEVRVSLDDDAPHPQRVSVGSTRLATAHRPRRRDPPGPVEGLDGDAAYILPGYSTVFNCSSSSCTMFSGSGA